MPNPEIPTDRDKAKPASTDAPDLKGDALIYRVPDLPPTHGTVTIDQKDGTFTYTPSLDSNTSD